MWPFSSKRRDSELRALQEVEKVKQQIANSDPLDFDANLISDEQTQSLIEETKRRRAEVQEKWKAEFGKPLKAIEDEAHSGGEASQIKGVQLQKQFYLDIIWQQLENGLEITRESSLVSEDDILELRQKWELEKVKKQLAKSETLTYDPELITEETIGGLRKEAITDNFRWINSRHRPEPQPYGVSNYGAEALVADWLVYLGCKEVVLTQASQDGGVDVETSAHLCQVKYYKNNPVSVQEVREIFGVASAAGKAAMIFTSSDLTAAAYEFANQVGIIAVQFNVEESFLVGLNSFGKELLEKGEYE